MRSERIASPVLEDAGRSELSLISVVEALFRRWKMVLLIGGLTIGLGLLWTFATQPSFASDALILVQNARSNVQISATSAVAPTVVQAVTPEQLSSELAVFTSTDLLDDVVDPGWRSRPLSAYSPERVRAHQAEVLSLSRGLDVSVARQSYVLVLKLVAGSPAAAQQDLDRLIKAFLARQRQIARPAGATQFFAEQAEHYRLDLADAQAALARFQSDHNLVGITEGEAKLSGQGTSTENQLLDTDVQISDLQRRIQTDAEQLKSVPARQTTQERTVPLSGALDQLTTQLVMLQNQRTQLLTKFLPGDRLIQQVDTEITQTEAGIRAATTAKTQDTATDVSPVWQRIKTELSQDQAELDGLRARRGVLAGQAASSHERLVAVESVLPEFSALQHRVTELDNNYQVYVGKRNEAQVADAMDQQDLLNFAVVQSPTFSPRAIHPRPIRDLLLTLLTAALLAGVAVFLAESARSTFAKAGELERAFGAPVLATLPLERVRASLPSPAAKKTLVRNRTENAFYPASDDVAHHP